MKFLIAFLLICVSCQAQTKSPPANKRIAEEKKLAEDLNWFGVEEFSESVYKSWHYDGRPHPGTEISLSRYNDLLWDTRKIINGIALVPNQAFDTKARIKDALKDEKISWREYNDLHLRLADYLFDLKDAEYQLKRNKTKAKLRNILELE